jgi:hypothetical protein
MSEQKCNKSTCDNNLSEGGISVSTNIINLNNIDKEALVNYSDKLDERSKAIMQEIAKMRAFEMKNYSF